MTVELDGRRSSCGVVPDEAPALALRGLSKSFPGTRALIGVDLDVRPGEIHALVGQNGSGKSTLIKLLAGFHQPDPGADVAVNGCDHRLGDPDAAHDAGLRFVHQDLGLVPTLDTVDNMAFGAGYLTARTGRIRWREQTKATRRAITALGYELDVHTPVAQLDPIEKTAVAVARALRGIDGGISLLVLDEPTAAMPRPDVDRLFEILRRVRDGGIGVLYVSHHLDEVFSLADRVTVLRDGRVVGTRETTDLTPRSIVEMMTGGVFDPEPSLSSTVSRDTPMLRLDGLAGHDLIRLDLTVYAGEVVGLAGINGSGRDEVCDLIFGGAPRSGEVEIAGHLLEPLAPHESVDLGVGLVPADRHEDGLFLPFAVRENLTLGVLGEFWRNFRLQRGDERRDAERSIARLGVKTAGIEAPVESLSGGNQQKVVLGRWLSAGTRVLLLDEPTQGVDVAAKAEVHHLIDEAARNGTAVIVSSSDDGELERLCDRVVVMRGGRVAIELHRPHISAQRLSQECLMPATESEGSLDR